MDIVSWIIAGALLGGGASLGFRVRTGLALNVVTATAGVVSGGLLLRLLLGESAFEHWDVRLASLLVSLLWAAVMLTVLEALQGGVASPSPTRRAGNPATVAVAGSGIRYPIEGTEMKQRTGARLALRGLITTAAASILLLVGGCASAPLAPDSALDAAKVAIANAEKAEAGQYAGAELAEAREKLALADNAVRDEDMVMGERFARESQVQAELASARTAAAKAASVNEQLGRGAEALAEEMQRAGEPR